MVILLISDPTQDQTCHGNRARLVMHSVTMISIWRPNFQFAGSLNMAINTKINVHNDMKKLYYFERQPPIVLQVGNHCPCPALLNYRAMFRAILCDAES